MCLGTWRCLPSSALALSTACRSARACRECRVGRFPKPALSEFRQDVEFEWREPAARLAVAIQFGLAALECVQRDVGQPVHVSHGLETFGLALADGIAALPDVRAPLIGGFTGFLQGQVREAAQPHFVPTPVQRVAVDPLRATVRTFVESQPAAIRVFAGTRCLGDVAIQAVQTARHLNLPSICGVP